MANIDSFKDAYSDNKVSYGERIKEAEHFIENQKYKNTIIKPFISAE